MINRCVDFREAAGSAEEWKYGVFVFFFLASRKSEHRFITTSEVYKTKLVDEDFNFLFKPDGACVQSESNPYRVSAYTQHHYDIMYRKLRPHFDIKNRFYHNSDDLYSWISSLRNVLKSRIHRIMICMNQITKFHDDTSVLWVYFIPYHQVNVYYSIKLKPQ